MTKKNLWFTAASAVIVLLLLPTSASAQDYPEHACVGDDGGEHNHTTCEARGTDTSCDAIERCVCDTGYHMDGLLANGNPNCVRRGSGGGDGSSYGSYTDPLCAAGSVRGSDGECMCPESLGARRYRTLTIVSRSFAESIADQIEDFDQIRRHGRVVALQVCIDPLASAGASGSLPGVISGLAEQGMRIICGSAAGATDEQVLANCAETRTLIESIRNLAPGATTITYDGNTYTIQAFVDEVLVRIIGEIQGRLTTLEGTVREHGEVLGDHEERIDNLELAWNNLLDVTHVRFGGVGRLGFLIDGPATGAGAATGELLIRFGSAPVGFYGRIEFGGQETGYDVGGSLYLSGGAGFAFFTGGRRDTTISLGLFAEDLLEPFADDPMGVLGSEVGVALGAELSASMPLPGDLYWIRIRAGLGIAYGERSYISDNGAFTTVSGPYVAPSLGLEFQPDFR